jgi:hypothetical protein
MRPAFSICTVASFNPRGEAAMNDDLERARVERLLLAQLKRIERLHEQQARYVARRAGYVARKSRRGVGSPDNRGGFMLIDPNTNSVIDGDRFQLSAEDVIDYCNMLLLTCPR